MNANLALSQMETPALLALFAGVMEELRQREVCRSSNNPVADYAEFLVARALGLELAPKSSTGFDAEGEQGRRYEIKARRPTKHNRSRQLSPIRGLDEKHFEYLVGVLFNDDFSVQRACLIPHGIVQEVATYRKHVNGWILHLAESLWNVEGVEDITPQLQLAEQQVPKVVVATAVAVASSEGLCGTMTLNNPRRRLQGDEKLHGPGLELRCADVLGFWRWAFGDLCHNNLRGVFAEWLVAQVLGIDLPDSRDPWAAHDLTWRDGLTIEVKCCAAFQAWHQTRQTPSRLEWSIPKTRTWSALEGYAETPSHNANLYVLCAQIEEDASLWDPLDLEQWRFHVLTREQLTPIGTVRISRHRLGQFSRELKAEELQGEVSRVADQMGENPTAGTVPIGGNGAERPG